MPQDPIDDVGAEASGEQKACLSAALFQIRRRDTELAAPDFERAIELGDARLAGGRCSPFFGDPLGAQIVLDAGRAELARHHMDTRFRKAGLGKKLALNEVLQQCVKFLFRFGVRQKLAPQLGAAVFPPREESEGTLTQRTLAFQGSARQAN
jgi:hypothetical protein